MNQPFVLSLFPGADLLGLGFEQEGYCVVSGPEIQFGRDVKCFHPPAGKFDGIIGGPPCQQHSKLARMARHMNYAIAEDLIPEFERCVAEAAPEWFLMENVEDAPVPVVTGYAVCPAMLNNRWFGEEQNRDRRFSFGLRGTAAVDLRRWLDVSLFENPVYAETVTASSGRGIQIRYNSGGKMKKKYAENRERYKAREIAECLRLQGLPADFFTRAESKKAPTFTMAGKYRLVGNGVPVPMARQLARAIRQAVYE